MKKNKQQKQPIDKKQVFTKIMAGILAVLMVFSVAVSLIYALI